MTLIDLITAQSARLKSAGVSFGHGTTNAFDEAAWLVLWALGMPLDALEAKARIELPADDQAKAEALVTRRIETRRPAAYLTHEAWLQNVPFYVDERTIVPRSFIAELLADGEGTGILDAWLSDTTHRVLDLCTGNGSLAVIAAMAYPEVVVDAADISDDALALAGGADGMDLVRTILRDAARHMTVDAVLVLEIGNERAHFEHAFRRLEVAWLETSAGDDQVLLVTREALSTYRWT